MIKTSTIVLMLICLFTGALIGYSAKTIAVIRDENKNNTAYSKYPRKSLIVKIETAQREPLFSEMRNFADTQGFAIRIAPTSPNGTDFIVEMWRADVNIIALNSFDPGIFSVDFYDTDSAILQPEFVHNSLANDIKSYLNEIPNITITEEK